MCVLRCPVPSTRRSPAGTDSQPHRSDSSSGNDDSASVNRLRRCHRPGSGSGKDGHGGWECCVVPSGPCSSVGTGAQSHRPGSGVGRDGGGWECCVVPAVRAPAMGGMDMRAGIGALPNGRTRAMELTTMQDGNVASFPVVGAHRWESALHPTNRIRAVGGMDMRAGIGALSQWSDSSNGTDDRGGEGIASFPAVGAHQWERALNPTNRTRVVGGTTARAGRVASFPPTGLG